MHCSACQARRNALQRGKHTPRTQASPPLGASSHPQGPRPPSTPEVEVQLGDGGLQAQGGIPRVQEAGGLVQGRRFGRAESRSCTCKLLLFLSLAQSTTGWTQIILPYYQHAPCGYLQRNVHARALQQRHQLAALHPAAAETRWQRLTDCWPDPSSQPLGCGKLRQAGRRSQWEGKQGQWAGKASHMERQAGSPPTRTPTCSASSLRCQSKSPSDT